MEKLIKKIQKLRDWEHLGLITTTGNTSDKGLNEFLLELENEALRIHAAVGRNCQCTPDDTTGATSVMCCNNCGMPTEYFWNKNTTF